MTSSPPGKNARLLAVVGVTLLSGALLLGAFLDAVQNASALSSSWRRWGSGLLLGATLLIDVVLRWITPAWSKGASHVRLTRLGPVPWAGVTGATCLLWFAPMAPTVPAKPVSRGVLSEDLPLFVGASWRFSVAEMKQEADGTTRVHRRLGAYTDSISFVRSDLSATVKVAEATRTGDIPEVLRCGPSVPRSDIEASDPVVKAGSRIWIVTNGSERFEDCDEGAALEIASALAQGSKTHPSAEPEYVFPLQVGGLWGSSRDAAHLDDGSYRRYQWQVESREDVNVPAGSFQDCFKIAYRTNPDDLVRWVCKGVGLVAWEYAHSGSVEQYRAELVEWQLSAKERGVPATR